MLGKKNIIVVAPDKYKDFARELSHLISKKHGFSSSYWSVEHFEANECNLSGEQYAIFIGNPDENSLTEAYLRVIGNISSKYGACYGYDSSKAIVFGEGKEEQLQLVNQINNSIKGILSLEGSTSNENRSEILVFIDIIDDLLKKTNPVYYYIQKYFLNGQLDELKNQQLKLAILTFLNEEFNDWTSVEN
ncbi:hypothetical protein [Desulfonatronum lacustre]|uniref:hypothetical protein n=1 Tax=Desulfonatronum lacustre TaxID=66849 RepID=UPI0012EC9419|nr:hypothetical protein [Desulfonatronum lacustre]